MKLHDSITIPIIAGYHFLLQNGLEKIFCETYFKYDNVKRPLEKCKNGVSTKCIGMPSGHAETITIIASLLYLHKFISLPLCILLIFIFSAQRIISNMHTVLQVIVGIIIAFIYVQIYYAIHLSFLLVFIIGIILALLSVYKIDQQIYGVVPDWVDPNMLPSIKKKQNTPLYSKIGSIYINAVIQNTTFISWKQLEKYLDVIVERIKHSGRHYDAVVGIKTGGAIISDYISQKLGITNYKIKLSRSEYNCDKKSYNAIHDIIQKRIFKNYGEYTICEEIRDNLEGKNIILIDELVSSGKTMNEAYNYLQHIKNANDIYAVSVALEKDRYKEELPIDYVITGNVLIWPWGYDN